MEEYTLPDVGHWGSGVPVFCLEHLLYQRTGECKLYYLYPSVTGLGSAVVRASAYGTGGPGFNTRGRVIPKTLKMVVMASLLGAQELGLAL